MTIRKGEAWGEPVPRPDGLVVLGSDAELAAWSGGAPVAPGAGDLFETLGAPPNDRAEMQRVAVDALRIVLDDSEEHWAIAHVVARRSWWWGPVIAAMNVGQIGTWQVVSRAHPNDGLVDVVEVDPSMTPRARWAARTRLPAGAHVPHPKIRTGRHRSYERRFDRPVRVWADGHCVGAARHLVIDVVADHYTVHF